jgi:hypothetical protein
LVLAVMVVKPSAKQPMLVADWPKPSDEQPMLSV